MKIIGRPTSDTLKSLQYSTMTLGQAYPVVGSALGEEIPQIGEDPGGYPSQARILYWYHPDYIQNVDLITDLDGEAYELFLYNSWGEQLHHWSSNSSSWTSPYRFNAKEQDPETGLAYYGARYYQSKLGVWLSTDPLYELASNLSPYRFSFNNPINVIDPNGLFEDPIDAKRSQFKATKKLGEDRVGEVYFDSNKKEYAYRVYNEGENKYTRGEDVNDEVTVIASRGVGIYNDNSWNKYKSKNGLHEQFAFSGSFTVIIGGGASFSFGLVQDKYGAQKLFHTWGGGVGFENGLTLNYGQIVDNNGHDFHVEDFEGKGFAYGLGIGPAGLKLVGNTKEHGFNFSGKGYMITEESGSPEGIGILLKRISKFKLSLGGSYQWTNTNLH